MGHAIARNRSEYGQSAVDVYTPLHFGVGFVAGLLGVSPVKATFVFLLLKVGVATAEQGMGHALFRREPGESTINELCDLLAEIGGVTAGAKFREGQAVNPAPPPAAQPVLSAPLPVPLPSVSGWYLAR